MQPERDSCRSGQRQRLREATFEIMVAPPAILIIAFIKASAPRPILFGFTVAAP
jgi:hypothetical protein